MSAQTICDQCGARVLHSGAYSGSVTSGSTPLSNPRHLRLTSDPGAFPWDFCGYACLKKWVKKRVAPEVPR